MKDMNEKRMYERSIYNLDVRVLLKTVEDYDNKFISGKAINISGGGLYFNSDNNFKIGDKVNILFLKPNSFDFFKGDGEIVRIIKERDDVYSAAIDFIGLSSFEKNMLDYYINSNKS